MRGLPVLGAILGVSVVGQLVGGAVVTRLRFRDRDERDVAALVAESGFTSPHAERAWRDLASLLNVLPGRMRPDDPLQTYREWTVPDPVLWGSPRDWWLSRIAESLDDLFEDGWLKPAEFGPHVRVRRLVEAFIASAEVQ